MMKTGTRTRLRQKIRSIHSTTAPQTHSPAPRRRKGGLKVRAAVSRVSVTSTFSTRSDRQGARPWSLRVQQPDPKDQKLPDAGPVKPRPDANPRPKDLQGKDTRIPESGTSM